MDIGSLNFFTGYCNRSGYFKILVLRFLQDTEWSFGFGWSFRILDDSSGFGWSFRILNVILQDNGSKKEKKKLTDIGFWNFLDIGYSDFSGY
jgi:hypothetical protein